MNRTAPWIGWMIPLVCLTWIGWQSPRHTPAPHLMDAKTDALLRGATQVHIFRIEPMQLNQTPAIQGYKIIATGKAQDKAFTERLIKALFIPKNPHSLAEACFRPGVAFRLWNGKRAVDVLTCFQCNNIAVFAPTRKGGSGDIPMDASRPLLIRLVKEVFPNDKEIQALR